MNTNSHLKVSTSILYNNYNFAVYHIKLDIHYLIYSKYLLTVVRYQVIQGFSNNVSTIKQFSTLLQRTKNSSSDHVSIK